MGSENSKTTYAKSSSIKVLDVEIPSDWIQAIKSKPKRKEFIWTPEKIAFIKKYYSEYSCRHIGEILGHSMCSIRSKIARLRENNEI